MDMYMRPTMHYLWLAKVRIELVGNAVAKEVCPWYDRWFKV